MTKNEKPKEKRVLVALSKTLQGGDGQNSQQCGRERPCSGLGLPPSQQLAQIRVEPAIDLKSPSLRHTSVQPHPGHEGTTNTAEIFYIGTIINIFTKLSEFI